MMEALGGGDGGKTDKSPEKRRLILIRFYFYLL